MFKKTAGYAAAAIAAAGLVSAPALAHHSFAMYDASKTLTMTGVMYRFVAQAAHAEMHFYLIGDDGKLVKDANGKNVTYGIEMGGAAQIARQGITGSTFKAGTIFSVRVNPMRDGTNFGAQKRGSAIAKCPWKKPPAPGKTCDTVAGSEILGGDTF